MVAIKILSNGSILLCTGKKNVYIKTIKNNNKIISIRPKKKIQLFLRHFLEKTDEAGRFFFFFFFFTKKQMRPLFFFGNRENMREKN